MWLVPTSLESETMKLTIPLPPSHFQRPRGTNHYSPHQPALDDWRQLITNQMRIHGHPMLEGPVAVHLHIGATSTDIEVVPIVGDEPARPKGVRADLDNIAKFDLDALEKTVYFNDRQVVAESARFK